EAAYVMLNSAQELARLGHEALDSGNFAGADRVADGALDRDPGKPEAKAIKDAAHKGLVTCRAPAANEPELRLAGTEEIRPAAGSLLSEVLAEAPGFLRSVCEERKVIAGKVRAEFENSLNAARKVMGMDPTQA